MHNMQLFFSSVHFWPCLNSSLVASCTRCRFFYCSKDVQNLKKALKIASILLGTYFKPTNRSPFILSSYCLEKFLWKNSKIIFWNCHISAKIELRSMTFALNKSWNNMLWNHKVTFDIFLRNVGDKSTKRMIQYSFGSFHGVLCILECFFGNSDSEAKFTTLYWDSVLYACMTHIGKSRNCNSRIHFKNKTSSL